ncbi:hypothetical protein [Actinoalloteichus caeruleus]|uniref:hypothetical protein n=1 Tax=Actinoalloteichus cyanogriseus TaxID=2893586 RepID=UPI003AAF0237
MSGFEVAEEELAAVGDSLSTLSEDLDAVCRSWKSGTGGGGGAFTTSDCAEAFDDLARNLAGTVLGHSERVGELGEGVRRSSETYTDIDDERARAFDGKGVSL